MMPFLEDPSSTPLGYLQYGINGVMMGVLVFIVRTLQQVQRESAERSAVERKNCDDRNDKTILTVSDICDKFGNAQESTTKVFSETTMTLVREQRAASERREDQLLTALKEMKKP